MRQQYKILSLVLLILGVWTWGLGSVTAEEDAHSVADATAASPEVLLVDILINTDSLFAGAEFYSILKKMKDNTIQ